MGFFGLDNRGRQAQVADTAPFGGAFNAPTGVTALREPSKHAGLTSWLGPISARDNGLRSPQLDNSHAYAAAITRLNSGRYAGRLRGNESLYKRGRSGGAPAKGHPPSLPLRASAYGAAAIPPYDLANYPSRTSAPPIGGWDREWASDYHHIVRPVWVAVPVWAVTGPPRYQAGRNRDAFRQPQQAIKTTSLQQSLKQAAAFARAANPMDIQSGYRPWLGAGR